MDRFCSQCGAILEVREIGGRGRPVCPACGHVVWSHFTLGIGGMLFHEGKVLLGLRNIEPDFGRWSMPGGYVEMDETLEQAVVREFREETGLQVQPLGLLAILQSPGQENNHSWCIWGVRLAGPLADLAPDPVEVQQVRFFAPEELDSLENVGHWSRWLIQNYRPEDAPLHYQEIDPRIKARFRNPKAAMFCAVTPEGSHFHPLVLP